MSYTALVSKLLFPLHEALKGHRSVSVRRFLEQSQWWKPEQLEELRLARLRDLIHRAEQHVPYYRNLFAQIGFTSQDLHSLGDLAKLPLLTKAEIRQNTEALKSEQARGLMRFNTGGSTGEPLIFFLGKERVSHDVAAKWRATRWWDVDIGDPEIVVWGSPIELKAQDRVRALRDRMLRTELLPAFQMSEARLDEFLAQIRRRRPKMLFGYPSAIAHIARHARRRGMFMDDLGIRVAFVTSETLYEDQRRDIGRVFQCPMANGYGSREAGFIAHQCPAGSLHITAEDVIVEILDESGRPLPAGQSGEIVVTHLATADFPFIRYRTGDVGALGDKPCDCGRGLPVLGAIEDRTTDFVVAADGTVMHGLALIYILRDLRGIRQFKIVQESLQKTRVLLATDANFNAWDEDTIRNGFMQRLGAGVKVEIERVSDIPREASGKYRYVESNVQAAHKQQAVEHA